MKIKITKPQFDIINESSYKTRAIISEVENLFNGYKETGQLNPMAIFKLGGMIESVKRIKIYEETILCNIEDEIQ